MLKVGEGGRESSHSLGLWLSPPCRGALWGVGEVFPDLKSVSLVSSDSLPPTKKCFSGSFCPYLNSLYAPWKYLLSTVSARYRVGSTGPETPLALRVGTGAAGIGRNGTALSCTRLGSEGSQVLADDL